MKQTIKISLTTVAFLSSLHAQESIVLEPLSIESTAIKTDELKSTDAVEIYTAQDIEKAHVQSVYEFLNEQTSVVTMPSYGNPFTQKLDFHGYGIGDGYQNIAVIINGRKINNIDMAAPLLSAISPNSIERIEIIKSSGIVTAGDGANAGVINIITKKNSNEKSVTFYGGTYGVADGSFSFNHSDDKLSISASGEAQKSDGIREIDADGNKDASKLSTGTFNLAYTPNKKLEFRLGGSFARTDVIYASYLTEDAYNANPAQKSNSYYPSAHQLFDTDTLNAGISYFISDKLSLHVDANHEKKKSNYLPSYVSFYDYNSAKVSLDYQSDDMSLSLGYDGFYGDKKGSSNTTTKNNNAGFIMSQFYLGNSTFKAGYRFEEVDYRYNSTSSDLNQNKILHGGELGYNYVLDKESSLFADYSHSYQAPDIDRFFGFDSSYNVIFNGFITPMEANNYTLGYNNIQKNNKFKLSFYYIDLKDEIYYYAGVNYVGAKNTNIDKSHKYGLDLSDKYIINNEFNLAFNYNYVQAIIDKENASNGTSYSGNQLPGVSNHNIKATLTYLPNEATTLALTQNYRSEAYAANDFENNFSQKQDAYLSTDISATYAQKTWEIFAKINNLFNQKNGLWVKDDAIYPVNFTTTAIAGFKLKF